MFHTIIHAMLGVVALIVILILFILNGPLTTRTVCAIGCCVYILIVSTMTRRDAE